MFQLPVLFRTLAPTLVPALLLAGCVMPARSDEPAPAAVAETVVEDVAETATVLTVAVTTDANVRAGPGIDHAAHFWLATDTEVVVTGRNADGTWLQIEHEDRPGWIFGALTDIGAEALAALPDTTPDDMTAAEPAPEPVAESAPTVEPLPVPTTATRPTVAVTGTVVNLRTGPGTEHSTDGQVRAGDQLQVLGRNADGTWLQVMHPVATGELVWIYGALTDIDAATVQALTDATAIVVEVATEPAPVVEPQPAVAHPSPRSKTSSPTARSGTPSIQTRHACRKSPTGSASTCNSWKPSTGFPMPSRWKPACCSACAPAASTPRSLKSHLRLRLRPLMCSNRPPRPHRSPRP